ncbi:glycosyltransferase family 2 protein [Kitasatospora phosalacinea]|uniref:Glycosyl transferase family 2 n=1 Tax=Kitasatospora phosalacinea TaxID=2065 RepID=A0A9W6PF84_9ACTN|nr:glycosyltransferase family 2 protein [Kitasatospora phosalacinea]GLW53823.1 glycosyl transferase family 2 [Kitasatospora phosalacinea]
MNPRPAPAPDPAPGLTLTVAICAYTLERWTLLRAAVDSVHRQQPPPGELLLVIDHNDELLKRASELAGVTVLANQQRPGLSGARNTALAAARGTVTAFLDDDAAARPGWSATLLAAYRDAGVLGAGGLVAPHWQHGRPRWFPPAFDWVVGCSHSGMPRRPARVRNLIGANMSFRTDAARAAGGFRTDLGRVGRRPLGCEETELCLRLAARHPGARMHYDPSAAVRHHVPRQRATARYFAARCLAEGRSKAMVARRTGPGPALASERAYLRRTVPAALRRALLHGRLGTATALTAGVLLTTGGYLAERAAQLTHHPVRGTP